MTEEKDEFEKLKKRIKEDTWEDYEGNHSHIDYDTIIEIIEEFKPKLKAQILQENPLAGLTNEELIYLKRLNEHVSNPVFSKFFVELFRRDKKGEID